MIYTKEQKRAIVKQWKSYEQGEIPIIGIKRRHDEMLIYEPSNEQIRRMLTGVA